MSSKTIRVLIVDDIVREGYRSLLAKHEGITVVGEASDAASALQSRAAGCRHHGYFDAGARRHRRDQAYPRVRCSCARRGVYDAQRGRLRSTGVPC